MEGAGLCGWVRPVCSCQLQEVQGTLCPGAERTEQAADEEGYTGSWGLIRHLPTKT